MPPPDGPTQGPVAPAPAAGMTTEAAAVGVVELDWRSVVVMMATFAAMVTVTGLAGSIPRTLSALAVATVLVLGLNPVVSMVARRLRVRRASAVVVVLGGLMVGLGLVAALLVPPAVRQARGLGDDIPEVVADLGDLPVIGDDLVDADVPARVEDFLDELPARLTGEQTPLARVGRSAVDGLVAAAVTLLFAITLLLDGDRLVRGAGRLLPARLRPRAERLADLTYRVVGRYVAGSLLVALVAGIATLVAGLALGVPLTPLLAVWVAVWDLVPQVGGAAGGIPFVLLGFTQGASVGIACGVFFVVYLQIENHILGPLLVGRAVKLSPPATMTAALVGVSAGGVVGALLAVPLLGAAKVVYLELRPPVPLEPDDPAQGGPGPQPAAGLQDSPAVTDDPETTVWFNPGCSNCRNARDLLADRGVDPTLVRYLDDAPDRAELERVMGLLGISDPRAMMRTGEAVYDELGLADADAGALLDAMTTHPVLIQRPIVIRGDRAVIARPPERLLELLGD